MLTITQFSRASSSFLELVSNKNKEQAAENAKEIKNSGKYNNIREKKERQKENKKTYQDRKTD